MSSLPFYSPRVREALARIISNSDRETRAERDGGSSAADRAASVPSAASPAFAFGRRATTTAPRGGTAIRGRWSGGCASSSSEEEEGDRNNAVSDDDDSSSPSSSSLDAIREAEEVASSASDARGAAANAVAARRPRGKGRTNKKSRNKKSREEMVRRMGRAPSVLLPFDSATTDGNGDGNAPTKVLEVPNALLPRDYLRDNPNWDVPSAAESLSASWDRLRDGPSDPTVLVVLIQSGRFAACVFSLQRTDNNSNATTATRVVAHRTSTRYTVRKGQGGSQSSNDQSKGKAKSVGAQLRREGERQLREDVRETWREWKGAGYVDRAAWVFAGCPKGMRRDYLFGGEDGGGGSSSDALLRKDDGRLRSVPLDAGRPTMEAASAVLECVLNCELRDATEDERRSTGPSSAKDEDESPEAKGAAKGGGAGGADESETEAREGSEGAATPPPEAPPLTPLHEAVVDGDLPRLLELLELLDESEESGASAIDYDVNTTGGPDRSTPLHLASSSTRPGAPSLLDALLVRGRADPAAIDARGRPPYFVASSDRAREAFRLARGTLGEAYCAWDDGARVGPALSDSDVRAKKAKAAEKKRRQRARQKEKKALEKAETERAAAEEREEEERKKREEDAKRARDGLKPKQSSASNACDFCQKVVRGKRRSQMFQRLEYAYCSTECVRRHQRELTAAAATARLGKS